MINGGSSTTSEGGRRKRINRGRKQEIFKWMNACWEGEAERERGRRKRKETILKRFRKVYVGIDRGKG